MSHIWKLITYIDDNGACHQDINSKIIDWVLQDMLLLLILSQFKLISLQPC